MCEDCNNIGDGCTHEYILFLRTDTVYPRSRFHFSEDTGKCHDCGIKHGNIHHLGCDVERCPKCSGQLISCDCYRAPDVHDRDYICKHCHHITDSHNYDYERHRWECERCECDKCESIEGDEEELKPLKLGTRDKEGIEYWNKYCIEHGKPEMVEYV